MPGQRVIEVEKRIDVAELLSILDTTTGEVPVLRPAEAGAITEYEVPVADFALSRVSVNGSDVIVDIDGPTMVLATAGRVSVRAGDGADRAVPIGTAAPLARSMLNQRLRAAPGAAMAANAALLRSAMSKATCLIWPAFNGPTVNSRPVLGETAGCAPSLTKPSTDQVLTNSPGRLGVLATCVSRSAM